MKIDPKFIDTKMSTDEERNQAISAEEAARIAGDNNLNDIKVNKAGDTMSGSLDLGDNNIDNVNKITEKSIITTPTYTTVTQDGSFTLTNNSTSVHFLTGTASNFSVIFPDATTLQKGQNYEIYNRTSSPVMLKSKKIYILSIKNINTYVFYK